MPGVHRSSEPVFVDGSGRRRQVIRVVGTAAAATLLGLLALLVAGFAGGNPLHVPGFADLPVDIRPEAPADPATIGSPAPTHRPEMSLVVPSPAPASATPAGPGQGHGHAPTAPPGHVRPSRSR